MYPDWTAALVKENIVESWLPCWVLDERVALCSYLCVINLKLQAGEGKSTPSVYLYIFILEKKKRSLQKSCRHRGTASDPIWLGVWSVRLVLWAEVGEVTILYHGQSYFGKWLAFQMIHREDIIKKVLYLDIHFNSSVGDGEFAVWETKDWPAPRVRRWLASSELSNFQIKRSTWTTSLINNSSSIQTSPSYVLRVRLAVTQSSVVSRQASERTIKVAQITTSSQGIHNKIRAGTGCRCLTEIVSCGSALGIGIGPGRWCTPSYIPHDLQARSPQVKKTEPSGGSKPISTTGCKAQSPLAINQTYKLPKPFISLNYKNITLLPNLAANVRHKSF